MQCVVKRSCKQLLKSCTQVDESEKTGYSLELKIADLAKTKEWGRRKCLSGRDNRI